MATPSPIASPASSTPPWLAKRALQGPGRWPRVRAVSATPTDVDLRWSARRRSSTQPAAGHLDAAVAVARDWYAQRLPHVVADRRDLTGDHDELVRNWDQILVDLAWPDDPRPLVCGRSPPDRRRCRTSAWTDRASRCSPGFGAGGPPVRLPRWLTHTTHRHRRTLAASRPRCSPVGAGLDRATVLEPEPPSPCPAWPAGSTSPTVRRSCRVELPGTTTWSSPPPPVLPQPGPFLVALRSPIEDWAPDIPTVTGERVHIDEIPSPANDVDVLVIGHTDQAVGADRCGWLTSAPASCWPQAG